MASRFEKFLDRNITLSDMHKLVEMIGNKKMTTIIKRNPEKMSVPHVIAVASILKNNNPNYNEQYIIDNYIKKAKK
jgi:hypothetical protein